MSEEEPLYRRDPVAWQAYLAEGNATQPRKRVGADALLRDNQGRFLLVNPKYKPDWDLPGGMAEANEPPHAAVQRELREELGLELTVSQLLVVDWVSPHGPWDDSLMFVFDCGVLTASDAAILRPRDDELGDWQFCTAEDAAARLRPYVWRRLQAALMALETGSSQYLENGYGGSGSS